MFLIAGLLLGYHYCNDDPFPPKPLLLIGNPAHDGLSTLRGLERAEMLGKAIGKECRGETAFFWSVRCRDGTSYQVQVHPDAAGSTNTIECGLLKAVANVSCFVPFNRQ